MKATTRGHGTTAANENGNPLVSIVIPTYNYGPYLPRAIESCLDQSHGKVEIIVVDDGSTDDTREVVRGMGRGILYVFQENRGVSSARNTGLGLAGGEFITFLDADDYLTGDALKTRLNAFLERPDIDFAITTTYSRKRGGDAVTADLRSGADFVSDGMDRMLLKRRLPFATCAVLIRTKVAKMFRFPVHMSNGEDIAYFTKVFFRRSGAFLNRPTAVTCSHPDSLRHRIEEIERQGDALIEAIFDDPYYDGALEPLRKGFAAHRYLEFFRRFYQYGKRQAAQKYLAKAIAISPATLIKVDYLIKLFRLCIGLGVQQKNHLARTMQRT